MQSYLEGRGRGGLGWQFFLLREVAVDGKNAGTDDKSGGVVCEAGV